MKAYSKTITFHWEPMLEMMIRASRDRQQLFFDEHPHKSDQPVALEIGLMGLSFGRQSGASQAVWKMARERGFHVLLDSRHIIDNQRACYKDAQHVVAHSIRSVLNGDTAGKTYDVMNGIFVLNDGLNPYNKVQIYQALQRLTEGVNRDYRFPRILPMVMVG